MTGKHILFISGSFGLGHITRDLAIARELKKRHKNLRISWLAAEPAARIVRQAGEELLPEAAQLGNDNDPAHRAARGFHLNLVSYLMQAPGAWLRTVNVFRRVTALQRFDCIIGDETYEIYRALQMRPRIKKSPFVMMYDFVGLDAMTHSPLERASVWINNWLWSRDFGKPAVADLLLFVGEENDVPDGPFGRGLPNRLAYAQEKYQFLGYVLPFDPARFRNRPAQKHQLGYGSDPLILCAIGGLGVGRPLLELCLKAFPLVQQTVKRCRMVLVTGPQVDPDTITAPSGVQVKGFVPDLYRHFAAADLVITQGGGTSTLELTAIRTPFIFFPVPGMSEQTIHVAGRIARHGAGVRMDFERTGPADLARMMLTLLGTKPSYSPVNTDGATRAAALIGPLLGGKA